ncbi:MAG: heat-inducible transcriptional repressor HrcA [Eubacteriales bacterium]|nr:heat-inducible transcriptional repressor HrcA [Eubacteriales bacterium]
MNLNGQIDFSKSFHHDPILAIDPPLSERQRTILKAIVERYIIEAEPVGSKNLLNRYAWDISSATVRKEMAELEAMGYLEQPHTSAGRVPSDKGYRAYVDELLIPRGLGAAEKAQLNRYFNQQLSELDSLLRRAADALSAATGLTALVLMPRYDNASLKQLHLILIEPGRALCILILTEGMVKDQSIKLAVELDQADLAAAAAAISAQIAGQRLHEISLQELIQALQVLPLNPELSEQIAEEIFRVIRAAEELDIYVQGKHLLLRQPEFKDSERAHLTFTELQKEALLAAYLCGDDEASTPSLMVRIGRELALENLQELSFISACYRQGPAVQGQIAVIGPRRMAYGSIISNLKYVRRALNSLNREQSAKEDNGA